MRKLFLLFLFFGAVLCAQVDDTSAFTNLFQDDDPNITKELRKRSATSVMESGVKVGVKLGFNYIIAKYPAITQTYFLDLPFAKRFSGTIDVGGYKVKDDVYKTDTTNWPGDAETQYLSVTGTMKIFIRSMWIGTGLRYNHFLSGQIMLTNKADSDGYKDYIQMDKSQVDNDISLLASVGYMAELRQNIFLVPEFLFTATIKMKETWIFSINFGIGLAFKL